ncbi:3',5'-cyclic-nucleotide phosphodiesterase [Halobacteriovorax sp. DPLXC-1]|uniref:3',5'-cyclic-nucleotide phosphodiesterase n=1 Tax=unclassified Halobacteriovorax TaxID=2639665 RepID=UPI002FEFB84D
MNVKIIGGHGGVSPECRATSYLVDGNLLIDAGSVATGVSVSDQAKIDNILISHSHLDHISDLAFLADNCFGMNDKPFDIWTCKEVEDNIMNHLFNDAIWPDFTKLPSKESPTMKFHNIESGDSREIGEYKVHAIEVNHFAGSLGFIIEKNGKAIVFTQDTGPTDKIWAAAKKLNNVVAIFCEVSFPNRFEKLALDSRHHTAQTLKKELSKMPGDVPIYLGHLKPNYLDELSKEIEEVNESGRIHILSSDNKEFSF